MGWSGSYPASLFIRRTVLRTQSILRNGSVIMDVGIDQGGVVETGRMTTLSSPTHVEEGVVHYAVPNIPGAVAPEARRHDSNVEVGDAERRGRQSLNEIRYRFRENLLLVDHGYRVVDDQQEVELVRRWNCAALSPRALAPVAARAGRGGRRGRCGRCGRRSPGPRR